MKPIIDEVAKKLRDALKHSICGFEGLYVFGSQVRGDATEDSDVDIVAIFDQDRFNLPDEFHYILSQISYDYYDTVDIEVLPLTREQLNLNYIFHDEVVKKGVFYGV